MCLVTEFVVSGYSDSVVWGVALVVVDATTGSVLSYESADLQVKGLSSLLQCCNELHQRAPAVDCPS